MMCVKGGGRLTWFTLIAFESIVDVDQGEVVALGVLEPEVTLCCLLLAPCGVLQETAGGWNSPEKNLLAFPDSRY